MFGDNFESGILQLSVNQLISSGPVEISVMQVFQEGIYDLMSTLIEAKEEIGLEKKTKKLFSEKFDHAVL